MNDIAVTGCNGQLGRAVVREAENRGLSIASCDIDSVDIRSSEAVRHWLNRTDPCTVINCAAYTAVDRAESNEAEALAVNATAVGHLAEICADRSWRLVHISTDYVFDGRAEVPYTEESATNPQSAYGRSKLLGEQAASRAPNHLIVRTAWLYGHGGKNFVETIRRQIEADAPRLRVVADQRGCPTSCDDLARAVLDLLHEDVEGIVHGVNSGETTWYGFARAIVDILQADVPVEPVTTDVFPSATMRPAYSVLSTSRLEAALGRSMPHWRDALNRYLRSPCAG